MTNRTITIEHNGKTYTGHIGTIKSTSLGMEGHGVWVAFLHTEWLGGGVGVGGYVLDTPQEAAEDEHKRRIGTAFGMDHVMQIVETVGVDTWEQLTGRQVIVLFEGDGGWGAQSKGIAGLVNDKVLILDEHAQAWRDGEFKAREKESA
ncbi:hypothetical protein [Puerhibacterium puerhi]|uniref:hypothetical protein n=1 Tax=Puerhibacterium puerhi TaxID=2692623 RepID=UPI00135C2D4E|nr:hypothetical protein [Puerhibacterium puerhi]